MKFLKRFSHLNKHILINLNIGFIFLFLLGGCYYGVNNLTVARDKYL